ncbi:hypothetical protein M758_5G122000 [Ceratodon purpureus]|nr:hypothetical protein M758_5G122000 [Ceratodon purpureus]
MAPMEECSIAWFTTYMALPNSGVVPTVTPPEQLPSKVALARFFGPKYGSGYCFDNHGNTDFELYVKELHVRVLQLRWPITGVVPYNFARGIVAEAVGSAVNWAEFGYKQTHPHQARSSVPRILPEFVNLKYPLPPLVKVLPRVQLSVPAVVGDDSTHAPAQYNTSQGGGSISSVSQPAIQVTRAVRNPSVRMGNQSARRPAHAEDKGKGKIDDTAPKLGKATLQGLSLIRKQVASFIEGEEAKLQEARHDSHQTANNLAIRLKKEKETLKFFQERVDVKTKSHGEMIEQHDKALMMLLAAKSEDLTLATNEEREYRKTFIQRSESLVASWYVNVDVARQRVECWTFKLNKQGTVVANVSADLAAAESRYAEVAEQLNVELGSLRAVSEFLRQL